MPRIRTLKPEHRQHRKIGPLDHVAYRLWVGMILEADDEGRLVAHAGQLRALVFPYHPNVTSDDVDSRLHELADAGLIVLYFVKKCRYAVFPSWYDHQRIDRPRPSILPCPPKGSLHEGSTKARGAGVESSSMARDGREGKGIEGKGTTATSTAKGGQAHPAEIRRNAEIVLEFLNQKTGRTFEVREATGKPTANLELIMARLKAGASIGDCKGVIVRKIREWRGTEHEQYLRPETLFNRTKFESYRGQRLRVAEDAEDAPAVGSGVETPPVAGKQPRLPLRADSEASRQP